MIVRDFHGQFISVLVDSLLEIALGMANHAANEMFNQALTPSGSDRSFRLRLGQALSASLRAGPFGFAQDRHGSGCIRDILVPHPSGGGAVLRLSCRFVRHLYRNDGILPIMRMANPGATG